MRRYRYRAYSTGEQEKNLTRLFGCVPVVFNDALAARENARRAGKPIPAHAQFSAAPPVAKRTQERAWLTEVSSVPLQQALVDLERAYRNFFASITGKRQARECVPPIQVQAFPAIGPVHRQRLVPGYRNHPRCRVLEAAQDRVGPLRAVPAPALAPDIGDGDPGEDPQPPAGSGPRSVRWPARSGRCPGNRRGSNNRENAHHRVAVLHRKVRKTRLDHHHKLAHRLIREKAAASGREVAVLDRDYNAAVNIMVAAGLAETLNACGGDVRRALARADASEAGTPPSGPHPCGRVGIPLPSG